MNDEPADAVGRMNAFLSGYHDSLPDPGVVWHYTSLGAAQSILSSGFFWATSLSHLADPYEMIDGQTLAAKRLEGLGRERPALAELVRSVVGGLREDPGKAPRRYLTYSTSFSVKRDDPWQWKQYGTPTGVAIGVGLNDLISCSLEDLFVFPLKCIYSQAEKDKLVEELADWTGSFTAVDQEAKQVVLYAAMYFAAAMKRPLFSPENEYRVVAFAMSEQQPSARTDPDAIERPYLTLATRNTVGRSCIRELMMGPGTTADARIVELAGLHGVAGDRITLSSVIPS